MPLPQSGALLPSAHVIAQPAPEHFTEHDPEHVTVQVAVLVQSIFEASPAETLHVLLFEQS